MWQPILAQQAVYVVESAVRVWEGWPLVTSLLMGLSVFCLVLWVVLMLESEDLEHGDEWRYDISRINELRRLDVFYRVFYPLIVPLARFNRAFFARSLPAIQREIQAAGLPRYWLAEEYLARAELIAVLLSPVYVYLCVGTFGLELGIVAALAAIALTVWLLRRRLAANAAYRIRLIKRRMPFLLDLLTLLMEAGATFLNALEQAVHEFRGHPIAEEFGRVLNDMQMGKTRAEAFNAMRERLADDEIGSIIGSILQGEQLGTPLGNVFRTQADVLRVKRSQRAETIASEAGVNMLLPGMLVMMAVVLIILGPFVLNFLQFGFAG